MRYALIQTIAPTVEPCTVAELKAQARIDTAQAEEDGILQLYLTTARQQVERETGRQVMLATYEMRLDAFPCTGSDWWDWQPGMKLPRPPLLALSAVTYVDDAGVIQTMDPADYVVDTASDPGRLLLAYNASWPSPRNQPHAVKVTFQAGYGATYDTGSSTWLPDVDKVPAGLKTIILLWAALLYENREPVGEKETFQVPLTIDRFLWPYRLASVLVG